MSFRVGVDVGGTFTDLAAVDEAGEFRLAKTLSTPGHEAQGVMTGLEKVASLYGLRLRDFLCATPLLVHGTTVATNTMLQYDGARTGLLTTHGFRDELEIRRGARESMFDVRLDAPYPIVPRRRRLGVIERVASTGQVLTPLDEAQAREAIRRLKAMGVEAIAVCFLFSFLNPRHEQRVRALIQEEFPEAYACISSEILPQIREFERTSTTVVNAYVGPKLRTYLRDLQTQLRAAGFGGDLFVMQSNGGVATVETAADRSVYALSSGPAGGIVSATAVGELLGDRDLITIDMGGTSFDVCLVRAGRPSTDTENWVNRYRVAVPMIEMHSIGAGGGSIAWLDRGGALRVGPMSAGARPGPACYGLGGEAPTVTDANLVLGYLHSDSLADREVLLDRTRAERAIGEAIAKPLGMTVTEAAHAIFRLVNSSMVNGIRVVSVHRGYDPRRFALMAFGGAGAIHAGALAADLSIPRVIVPRSASVFCAVGELLADVKVTEVQTFMCRLTPEAAAPVGEVLAAMARRAVSQLPQAGVGEVRLEHFADLRYVGEAHEITVPIALSAGVLGAADVDRLVRVFHEVHEQLYAYRDPENPIEALSLRVDAIGPTPKPSLRPLPPGPGDPTLALREVRPVFFDEAGGFVSTSVYDGQKLSAGLQVTGPCVVEEAWTTIVVRPGQTATLDAWGNYILTGHSRLPEGLQRAAAASPGDGTSGSP